LSVNVVNIRVNVVAFEGLCKPLKIQGRVNMMNAVNFVLFPLLVLADSWPNRFDLNEHDEHMKIHKFMA
jgi:hypothetical protein